MTGLQSVALVTIVALCVSAGVANSFPLSTRSRWIVDENTGQRVKLHCVNWAGHMEAMLPEGLNKRPLGAIASRIASLGFNCVRLTWATFMFTNTTYAQRKVSESFLSLGLNQTLVGIATHNPSLLTLTVVEAQEAVVDALGKAGVMVVLDNHVSLPQWCCGEDDGNGFFGDTYFNPKVWQQGLRMVAERYRGKPQVVGMSLRNELRGPLQNQSGWYQNVKRGVKTIHKANPDLLVVVSGLSYSTDFSFLAQKPLEIKNNASLEKKLVYEAHWYSFSDGKREAWATLSPSWVCANLTAKFEEKAGFLVNKLNAPLFLSEFGLDQRGANQGDNRFLPCFIKYAAERDLDWAIWALQGSYYRRHDIVDNEETFGILDANWDQTRDPNFGKRYGLLEDTLQEAASNASSQGWHYIVHHPSTGLCLQANKDNTIQLSDCKNRSQWSYQGEGTPIKVKGTDLCLTRGAKRQPVFLSSNCKDLASKWNLVPSSKVQVAATDEEGGLQCLDSGSSNSTSIFTRDCVCLEGRICSDPNPQSQWFVLISSNVL
ncbi:glycosyl hydrolase 5 family protein-like [Aristolochia californica]|uniref:glycosyl hydrolase 5 family protein-like n=1 Tax=Aristolochia californica TaxID=171875 RepID=UPI0035DFB8B0